MEREYPHSLRVVSIGGGTGQYHLLTGLREYNQPDYITAIAGTWDDGGDSGKRRIDEGVLPPGDARQCILALCQPGRQSKAARPLFNHRYAERRSLGNEIISFYTDWAHGDQVGLDLVRDLLLIDSEVLYVTSQDLTLFAKTRGGSIIEGESNIDSRHKKKDYDSTDRIVSLYFDTAPDANERALRAIESADTIVFPSGSLYGSLLPHLLVDGVQQAILNSKARLCFVLNLMTEYGQTDNYKASDHLEPFLDYLGDDGRLNYLIVNDNHFNPRILSRYEAAGQIPVELDEEVCQKLAPGMKIVMEAVASYTRRRDLLRHDHRLAKVILNLV